MRQEVLATLEKDPEYIVLTQGNVNALLDNLEKALKHPKIPLEKPWEDFFSAMSAIQKQLKIIFAFFATKEKRLKAKEDIDQKHLPILLDALQKLPASPFNNAYLFSVLKHALAFQVIHHDKHAREKKKALALWEQAVASELQKMNMDFEQIAKFMDPLVSALSEKRYGIGTQPTRREIGMQTENGIEASTAPSNWSSLTSWLPSFSWSGPAQIAPAPVETPLERPHKVS